MSASACAIHHAELPPQIQNGLHRNDRRDEVAAAIQDLTYVAQYREVDGERRKGFKVFCGGGTSIMPRLAKPLYEWGLGGRLPAGWP